MSTYLNLILNKSDSLFSLTFFEIADKLLKVVIGITATFFVAAVLGPETYSSIAVGLAMMSIISMWINSAMRVPFFQNYHLTLFSFILAFFFLAILVATSIIVFRSSNSILIENVLIIFIITSFFKFHNILRLDYEKNLKQKFFIIYENIILLFFLLFKISVAIFFGDVKFIALAYMLESISITAFFLFSIKTKLKLNPQYFIKIISESLEIIKKNSFVIMGSFVAVSYLAIDTIIIESVASSKEVGNWGISKRINQLIITTLTVSSNVFVAAHLKSRNVDFFNTKNIKFMVAIFFLSIVLSIFWILFGRDLVNILLGDSYMDAYGYVKILSIAWPAVALNAFIVQYILVNKLQIIILLVNIFLFFSVYLLTIFSYEYGGMNLISILMSSLMTISPFLLIIFLFISKRVRN